MVETSCSAVRIADGGPHAFGRRAQIGGVALMAMPPSTDNFAISTSPSGANRSVGRRRGRAWAIAPKRYLLPSEAMLVKASQSA